MAWPTGYVGFPELATEYGVSQACIFYIVNNKTWRHVT